MAATGGLMFGYDIGVSVSGGVTSMSPFLKKFFPVVYGRTQEQGIDSNYCKYDNQGLQLFTSSLYLAGSTATFAASYTTKKFGRRPSMLIAGVFFIVGTILNGCATVPFGDCTYKNTWRAKHTVPAQYHHWHSICNPR